MSAAATNVEATQMAGHAKIKIPPSESSVQAGANRAEKFCLPQKKSVTMNKVVIKRPA